MSHEIRTPLNGILALSEMLAQSDLPQRQQRYAGVISKSGKSLLSIINDILDFSKVEAGKMDLECVEVDLAEAAEDVASLFAAKAHEKGLDLAVFVHPALPPVLADPVRLRQVIGNLVNNAIKFTDTGGVLIEIEPAGVDVRVAVSDTGPGIPADRLPALFDAFTQADQTTTRKYGGTGLGLAICDRLVRSMGGTWDLASTVGEGSTFAFFAPFPAAVPVAALPEIEPGWAVRLSGLGVQTHRALARYIEAAGAAVTSDAEAGFVSPTETRTGLTVIVCRDEDQAAEVGRDRRETCTLVRPLRRTDVLTALDQLHRGLLPTFADAVPRERASVTFPGARVLVVDDSDVNREVATEALERLGVTVETANDGLQAIERVRARAYDMVLMDGSMPVLDGFEACRRIRVEEAETGRTRAVVIALTAHVVGAGANAWRDSGMDGVIHKPFTLADLTRELRLHCSAFAVSGHVSREEPVPDAETDTTLLDPVVRSELLSMKAKGRGEFVAKVHKLYADNAPARLAELAAAALAGDQGAAGRAAHALRSMSLSLGASAVAQAARCIEDVAAEGGPVGTDSVDDIRRLLEATLNHMALDLAPTVRLPSLGEQATEAMASGQIYLVYQPLADPRGGPAGKAEALVRWLHPVDGHRSPADFIPRLEAEGAIATLTDFVLARAMSDMAHRHDLVVSVNASAQEFQKPGFALRVADAVASAGFPPSRLEIEVTETAMLDVVAAARTISELQAAGVSVALDDFGAGFTSLHALRELRFNTLKIDQSFVERCSADAASAAIIHAVIGVGRALGMKVVCEGVETAEQAEFLRIAGVHMMQGYYFHRPMSLQDLPPISAEAA